MRKIHHTAAMQAARKPRIAATLTNYTILGSYSLPPDEIFAHGFD